MIVKSLQFKDQVRKWELEPTSFSQFNLLVGASGVGKTRILESLDQVRRAALFGAKVAPGCEWTLIFSLEKETYTWSAQTSPPPLDAQDIREADATIASSAPDEVRFIREKLERSSKEVLVERDAESFVFLGKSLPRLNDSDSAISLLRHEAQLKPLQEAMRRFLVSRAHDSHRNIFFAFDKKATERIEARLTTLEELRRTDALNILSKALLLERVFPAEFAEIQAQFQAIFPQVEAVRAGTKAEFDPVQSNILNASFDVLGVAIREKGLEGWLFQDRISSGMLRSLFHLLELALAPAGTIVLIDEFENSLGVNCLPQIADHLLQRSGELQFVITSHHPYVINNIPTHTWRVVTRRGSKVRVLTDQELPALRAGSRHDRFTLLLNLKEFEEGIS